MRVLASRPLPVVDELTAPYWDAAARGTLVMQRCLGCDRFWHFPVELCPRCHRSDALTWRPVSGRGVIYSFIVVHRARFEWFAARVPYTVVCLELEEQAGLRMFANLAGGGQPRIGATAKVTFEALENGLSLPQVRL